MGLLSKASTLENKGLAFSDFIQKHSLKTCAVLKENGNNYSVENSIGFDGKSIITATSTTDFWTGICNKEGIIKLFEKKDNSINTLLQLFSDSMKESLEELFIVKNNKNKILISEQEIFNNTIEDFNDLSDSKHHCDIEKLNPLIKDGSSVLKFEIDFSNSLENFLSSLKKDAVTAAEKNALLNEIYNRFLCRYNNSDASILLPNQNLRTVFITGRAYSVELITKHIILNLKEVLSDSADLIKLNYLGTAESYSETKEFLQAD